MARVTSAEVQEILDTTITLTAFITAATLLVDQHLLDADLPTALLKEIERWLAAHFACMLDPRLRDMHKGDTSATFELGRQGLGLQATTYGQQALALDASGLLALASTARPATFLVD